MAGPLLTTIIANSCFSCNYKFTSDIAQAKYKQKKTGPEQGISPSEPIFLVLGRTSLP